MAREIPIDPAHLERRASVVEIDLDNKESIIEAVEALPEQDRAVVECLIWGGMTKVECAELLGISRSYVHKIWRRARETLKSVL
tara:strand:+ start:3707 stop:3958 length:252 start_codon:yes stop_codon:yes gene_type:complete